jgi:D-glycero-alpha-D-manno-heptose-7-phosphate kinase
MKAKKVQAPVRVDFGGGTTDIYPFTHTHGGAVLNCGINRYVVGKIVKTDRDVHLEYTGHTPTSSGLGTSGVMNLVWLALISQVRLRKKGAVSFKDRKSLAKGVYALEQSMGLVGGKQDQYAAAFGGINYIEFEGDKVKLEQLKLSKNFIKKFESKLVLVYTGKPHFSGNTNKSMMDNLKKGKNTKNLVRIKNIAKEMKNALKKEDLYKFAKLMNEETGERKKLHRGIVGPRLQNFIDKGFKNGVIAAKVCGSGGGGSVLFFTDDKARLVKAFGKNVINFKFDFGGLKWI